MARLTLIVLSFVAAVSLVTGGCPAQSDLLAQDDGLNADPNGSGNGPADSSNDAPGDGEDRARPQQLFDIVTGLAAEQSGIEVARSYGSEWVFVGSDFPYDDLYLPDGGSGSDDGIGGGSDDDDGSAGGDDADEDDDTVSIVTTVSYSGGVQCDRHEQLIGFGEITEQLMYGLRLSFDADGVLTAVYVPAFAIDELVRFDARYAGESDTALVELNDEITHTMHVAVSYALYTVTSADVTLHVEQHWSGPHAWIAATGTHTIHLDRTAGGLNYVSQTHYNAELVAMDGWHGQATEDFALSGILRAD